MYNDYMDTEPAIAIVDEILKALKGLERALEHDDRRIVETELWNARQKLKALRETLKEADQSLDA